MASFMSVHGNAQSNKGNKSNILNGYNCKINVLHVNSITAAVTRAILPLSLDPYAELDSGREILYSSELANIPRHIHYRHQPNSIPLLEIRLPDRMHHIAVGGLP